MRVSKALFSLFLLILVIGISPYIIAATCKRWGACYVKYGYLNYSDTQYNFGDYVKCDRCVQFSCLNGHRKVVDGAGCLQDFLENCHDIKPREKILITRARKNIDVVGPNIIFSSCDYPECAKQNHYNLNKATKANKKKWDEYIDGGVIVSNGTCEYTNKLNFRELIPSNGTCEYVISNNLGNESILVEDEEKEKYEINNDPYSGYGLNETRHSVPRNKMYDGISLRAQWALGGIIFGIFLILILIGILILIRKRRHRKHLRQFHAIYNTKAISTKKFDREHLRMKLSSKNISMDFNTILGKGAFSTVYKGTLKMEKHKNVPMPVAVKIANAHFDQVEMAQFVREVNGLGCRGSHPHIIAFFGWASIHDKLALITELAQSNLLMFVQSFRGQEIPIKTMLSILWQISQALEYLASFMMVHRDVACRNILLMENNCAKLADFGLCCHCDDTLTYTTSLQKRLPLKWLSIEALVDRKFSEKSDVWAFGILCFEIFSFGSVPYPALSNIEMLEFLQSGNRLEQPPECPKEIYDLMMGCWEKDPQKRPTFKYISNFLRQILETETADYGYLSLSLTSDDEGYGTPIPEASSSTNCPV